jgi:carbamate kinase
MPDEPGHTAVIALGGNALAPSGAHPTITEQFRHARERLAPVVDLALDGRRLRVAHRDESLETALRRAGGDRDVALPVIRTGALRAGRVAPKVRAAVASARETGGRAVVTGLRRRGREGVRGDAGTTITAA